MVGVRQNGCSLRAAGGRAGGGKGSWASAPQDFRRPLHTPNFV